MDATTAETTPDPSSSLDDAGPPLASAACEVFETMLDCAVQPATSGQPTEFDVLGEIGIDGPNVRGSVTVGFALRTALLAHERLLCEVADDLHADVLDVVAELTNMVAGTAKSRLGRDDLELGIPVVRTRRDAGFGDDDGGPIRLDFDSELGDFGVRARFDADG